MDGRILAELRMLRIAIEAGDPKRELLLRVSDIVKLVAPPAIKRWKEKQDAASTK